MKRTAPSADDQGATKRAPSVSQNERRYQSNERPRSPLDSSVFQSVRTQQLSADIGNGGCAPCNNGSTSVKWEDADVVNAQIVKDLNEMSLKEREHIFDDIHGVHRAVEETEEFVRDKLKDMETALAWVRHRHAYERAKFLLPAYVQDRNLRLMMLRAHDYDPVKAAKLMVKYFDFKLKLFGIDLLTKDITQDDLSADMYASLLNGLYQLPRRKDRSGRSIFFVSIEYFPPEEWKAYFGMLWYVSMLALKDIEAQKTGFVCIINHIGISPPTNMSQELLLVGIEFERSIPCKAASYHFLNDKPSLQGGFSLFQYVLLNRGRLRVRAHFGSTIECMYKLMSFGITKDILPLDLQGNIDTTQWKQLLEDTREQERNQKMNMPAIVVPRSVDVVLGRGYPFQTHAGNEYLVNLIRRNRLRYHASSRASKARMMVGIVEYVKQVRGGLFLKRASYEIGTSTWIEAGEEESRKKVGHIFRSPTIQPIEQSIVESTSMDFTTNAGETILVPVSSSLTQS